MNHKELVTAVAARTGLGVHAADDAVNAVLDLIAAEVADGEQVSLAGFGIFDARDRAARTGRNPRTGEPLEIPADRTPSFRPAAGFRRRLAEVS